MIKSLNLTSAQPTDVKLTLEVGGVSELVTVASTSEIIQTQSTTISSTINTNQITKLPLTSRSAMDFVNFLPGVSTPGGNRDATINGLPQGSSTSRSTASTSRTTRCASTDGFFAIVSPRLDAIEEVSVTTAGQGADAGQGAVQIKFVTRSGGNSYTGSGYHYYRSDKLNANTWFNNRDRSIDEGEPAAEPGRRPFRRPAGHPRRRSARQGVLLRQLRGAAASRPNVTRSEPC